MSAPAAAELPPVRVRRAPALEPPYDDEAHASAPAQPLVQPGRGPRTQRPITPRHPRGALAPPAAPAGDAAPNPAHAAPADAPTGRRGDREVKVTARPALAPVPAPAYPARSAAPVQTGVPAAPTRPMLPGHGNRHAVPVRPATGAPASVAYRHRARGGPAHQLTPAQAAAQRFIGVCVEILNGHRPVNHLRAVVAAADLHLVTDQLVRRTNRAYLGRPGVTSPHPHRVRLRALRVGEPLDGVAEIVAVFEYGANHWAMCARLERRADTWLCTLVQVI